MTSESSQHEALERMDAQSHALMRQIGSFLDGVVKLPAELRAHIWAPFLVFVHPQNNEPFTLTLVYENDENHAFSFYVPIEEYDPSGWPDEEGLSLSERLGFVINKNCRDGVWRQASIVDLVRMIATDMRPFHPKFRLKEMHYMFK